MDLSAITAAVKKISAGFVQVAPSDSAKAIASVVADVMQDASEIADAGQRTKGIQDSINLVSKGVDAALSGGAKKSFEDWQPALAILEEGFMELYHAHAEAVKAATPPA